jgi:Tetratricopeptide repeat
LKELGRFDDARTEFEACLQIFQNDLERSARVRGSLAILLHYQGDVRGAITQERRSLALREQLPDPGDRATSHHNLAMHLARSSTPSDVDEAPRHQLAALVYLLVTGMGQDLQSSLRNYAIDFRRAEAASTQPTIPRLAELLADPAFRPLDDWFRQRGVSVDEVQATVDHFLEQARQSTIE